MTRDEARALLVAQGALMLEARLRGTAAKGKLAAAKDELAEARDEWIEAATVLVTDEFCEHEFSLGEERTCFEESLAAIGRAPDDPEFAAERKAFLHRQEDALETQRDYAELN